MCLRIHLATLAAVANWPEPQETRALNITTPPSSLVKEISITTSDGIHVRQRKKKFAFWNNTF
jgi:hypothetical protein